MFDINSSLKRRKKCDADDSNNDDDNNSNNDDDDNDKAGKKTREGQMKIFIGKKPGENRNLSNFLSDQNVFMLLFTSKNRLVTILTN